MPAPRLASVSSDTHDGDARHQGGGNAEQNAAGLENSADPRLDELFGAAGLQADLAAHATSRTLAQELYGLRRAAGLGVRELALRASWDPAMVVRMESGLGRIPTLASLQRYARACGAATSLIFRTDAAEIQVSLGMDVLGSEAEPAQPRQPSTKRRARGSVAELAVAGER